MDTQVVPKTGISSVVHSKHIDPDNIDVVGNDIALFDTGSITSLYSGPSKLKVANIELCLEGSTRPNTSLRELGLISGRMAATLPNQIIKYHQFSSDFRGIFLAMPKSLLGSLPRVGNMLSLFLFLKDYPCFDLDLHEQEMIKEYHAFIRKRLKNKDNKYRKEAVMGLIQGFFFELYNISNDYAPDIPAIVKSKSRKEYIFERFYEPLVQSYQSERSVKFYADQLCLTSKHLFGAVKEVSRKAVGEWTDRLVIPEVKALLNSSSMNVQEIADRLNFINQSLFSKCFKHYTGMFPREYRRNRQLPKLRNYRAPERARLSVSSVISR